MLRSTRGSLQLPTVLSCLALGCLALAAGPLAAVTVPEPPDPLAGKQLRHPDLDSRTAAHPPEEFPEAARARALDDLAALGLSPDHARLDPATGRWAALLPAEPLVPGAGAGNRLRWQELGVAPPAQEGALAEAVRNAFLGYLHTHAAALRLDPAELQKGLRLTVHRGGEWVQIHAPRSFRGLPVRGSYLTAVLRYGNLVLLGTHRWGDVQVSTQPRWPAEAALEVVRAHLAPLPLTGTWGEAHLALQPTGGGTDGAAAGRGFGHRLVWVLYPSAENDPTRWQALVDAHTGELLSFADTHQHATFRQVVGGVLPATNSGVPPEGVEQPGWPMPFADLTIPPTAACGNGVCETAAGEDCGSCPADCAGQQGGRPADRFCCGDGDGEGPVDCSDPRCTAGGFQCEAGAGAGTTFFANSSGFVAECLEGTVTTELAGRFVRVTDGCGEILESTAEAVLDLGTSPGGDCLVAGGASPGNTRSARTVFYELNRIRESAKGQLPGNAWLDQQLPANTNVNSSCGAFWNGSAVGFYRNGNGCANTGEVASIIDHEWGHGLDANDATPFISNPSEAIADIYAALRQTDSCIGGGFRPGFLCSGYGDPCTECDGVRDLDWAKRQSMQPHDVLWIDVNCGSSGGTPCGGSPFCESAVVSETVWDLLTRDLPAAFGMSPDTALEVTTRLTYLGAGGVGSWFQCSVPFGGCSAGGGYLNLLAADDDNGNLADGTPHMSALFAAFDRHGIACDTPAVQNGGCTGTPTTAPEVTAVPLPRGARLTWNAVAGAGSYRVFRTEGVAACDLGKQLVGETAGTEFTDGGLLNGREYFYIVVPMGPGDPCLGPASACTTVIPAAGGSACDPCGDGTCDAGEDSCSCPADCGAPPASEAGSCSDGFDDDCDGLTDCSDPDCAGDPACPGGPICGDGMCAAGEDCESCAADCPGRTGGKPAERFCCGNGVIEGPEGDGSTCDGNF